MNAVSSVIVNGIDIKIEPYHIKTAKVLLDTIYGASCNNLPTTTYKGVSEQTNRHQRTEVPYDIGDLSMICKQYDMPLISVIVVNQITQIPGDGFYPLCEDLYSNNESKEEIFRNELKKVQEYEGWGEFADLLGIRTKFTNSFRKVRSVTAEEIGSISEFKDIPEILIDLASSHTKTVERTARHQLLLKRFAKLLENAEYGLYEYPMDCLATNLTKPSLLIEAKTLDGSAPDEIKQVRAALSQILYYEEFNIDQVPGKNKIEKIILFESEISERHQQFLENNGCHSIWLSGDYFAGSDTSITLLKTCGMQIAS